MGSVTRLVKTAKGREEIEHRRYKLAGKLRTLLILIDGTRSIEDIAGDAQKLGAPEDAVIHLMREGFVAPVANAKGQGAPGRPTDIARGEAPSAVPAAEDDTTLADSEFARFRAAKQFMNDTAVDNMGAMKKFTFTLKLERCAVRQDLADLIDDYELSLTKSIGRDAATLLVERLRLLLR